MLKIGYHVSIVKSIDLAFDRAKAIGCTSMQIFLSNPRGWDAKKLGKEEIQAFIVKGNSSGISPIFAHMSYLPNIASPNEFAYRKSVNALEFAINRCNLLRIKYLILHLGSHLGEGKEVGFKRAVEAIGKMEGISKTVTLLLENESGQRNSIGSRIEDLNEFYARIYEITNKIKIGFCIDTCHLFEAGYDIRKEEVVTSIFDLLDKEKVHVIHLNDARYDLGRGLDRHENIGFGYIGKKGFENFLNYKAVRNKPLILETPIRGITSDKQEIKLVRSLIKRKV